MILSFGPTLADWRAKASEGRAQRLRFLIRILGLEDEPVGATRYQLLHRTASALIEAERFHAVAAVMLVHSFSQSRTGWTDFEAFLRMFGARGRRANPLDASETAAFRRALRSVGSGRSPIRRSLMSAE
jgi:hypothetical protein